MLSGMFKVTQLANDDLPIPPSLCVVHGAFKCSKALFFDHFHSMLTLFCHSYFYSCFGDSEWIK